MGSETPWRGQAASDRKQPFDSRVGEAEKVDQILAWLDLPEAERPRLILTWWHGADAAGHHHGPHHSKTRAMLRRQDRQLGRLLAGLDARQLWDELTLLLVSDHGMVEVERTLDLRSELRASKIQGRVFHASALAHVYLKRAADAPEAVSVLSALPGVQAFAREDLPVALRFQHARVGDVVAIAEPGLALWPHGKGLALRFRVGKPLGLKVGAHGYNPAQTRDVHGIFLAMGSGVAPGKHLPSQRTLDVAATVTALLGIEAPKHSEGCPIELGPSKHSTARP